MAEICDRGTAGEQRRELRRKIAAVESFVFVRRVRARAGLLPRVAARYAVADAGDAQGAVGEPNVGHLHRDASAPRGVARRGGEQRRSALFGAQRVGEQALLRTTGLAPPSSSGAAPDDGSSTWADGVRLIVSAAPRADRTTSV